MKRESRRLSQLRHLDWVICTIKNHFISRSYVQQCVSDDVGTDQCVMNELYIPSIEVCTVIFVGESKISHSMVYLETCLLDTLVLQVSWSGAITEVLARLVACPYVGEWPSSRPQSDNIKSAVATTY